MMILVRTVQNLSYIGTVCHMSEAMLSIEINKQNQLCCHIPWNEIKMLIFNGNTIDQKNVKEAVKEMMKHE